LATNLPPGATLGADKGYDARDFVAGLRTLDVTPHVARTPPSRQRNRRPDDPPCGVRGEPALAQTGRRDLWLAQDRRAGSQDAPSRVRRVGWMFTFAATVYNLVRIRNLLAEQAA
jgi:hypothetical protein